MGAPKLEILTAEDIRDDEYFRQCRERIKSSPEFRDFLNNARDLRIADNRIRLYMDLKGVTYDTNNDIKIRVAKNLRKLSGTGRFVAGMIFQESDPRSRLQMLGRDAKRWAAIVLDDIFTADAIIGDLDGIWDFWHE